MANLTRQNTNIVSRAVEYLDTHVGQLVDDIIGKQQLSTVGILAALAQNLLKTNETQHRTVADQNAC